MPILYETYAITSMQKAPTEMYIYLWDETGKTTRMENKKVNVGTKILIRTALGERVDGLRSVDGKAHAIFHRVNSGAWEKIADKLAVYNGQPCNFIEVPYTLSVKGVHTFVASFGGDEDYAASTSKEAKIGVGVAVAGIPTEYLIGGALAAGGIIFIALAARRMRRRK